MNERVLERPIEQPKSPSRATGWERLCKALLLKKLAALRLGRFEMVDESTGEQWVFGEAEANPVRFVVHRPAFYPRAVLGGSSGVGESYAWGDWDSDDLTGVVRLFVVNRDAMGALDGGWNRVSQFVTWVSHQRRRNTERGARANILAHYDLGNDFFEQFLDETWMYSCGIFPKSDSTLQEASTEKIDRICRKLRLTPRDRLLEIGAGWGGFACHAAKNYGCRVTTTTISDAQFDFARARIQREGLTDRVTLLKQDYRRLTGQYDKVVSIEMIEAVGLDHLDVYFKTVSDRLTPAGSALIQSIIIRDHYYAAAKRSVDFIQKHIFPGSGIPSLSAITGALATHTDLLLSHQEDLTPHYARTLRAWNDRMTANAPRITALGYTETLQRLWRFYFSYCEGGFLEKSVGVVQMLFTKPNFRGDVVLGDL